MPADRSFSQICGHESGMFNGRERHLDEWEALLAAADERFVLHRVYEQEQTSLAILEVHWGVSSAAGA